jgi:hypothetical protein
MENAIRIVMIVNLTVMGFSHVFAHCAWGEFFERLCQLGRPGAFAMGFLTLLVGSLIVGFHNVWTGIPIVLTLLGWAYVIKSLVIFIHPDWGVRSMQQVNSRNSRKLIVPGVFMMIVAGVLLYVVLTPTGTS